MQTLRPLEGNTAFVSCALCACLTLSINKWRATCLRLAQVVKIGDYQATLLSMGARPKLSEAQPEPKRGLARSYEKVYFRCSLSANYALSHYVLRLNNCKGISLHRQSASEKAY